jgi:hypothetical protein
LGVRDLASDSRRTILRIKHELYKAVLRDGVDSYEQFERWLAEHPPKKLEDWMP